MFGGETFSALDRPNNLLFRGPTLLHSILSMRMEPDFHERTLTPGIGTINLPLLQFALRELQLGIFLGKGAAHGGEPDFLRGHLRLEARDGFDHDLQAVFAG